MSDSWHTILTPTARAGAIAMIMLRSPDPERLGIKRVGTNALKLRDLFGIDTGVVMGLPDGALLLMPHGGIAIVRALSARLAALGVPLRADPDPVGVYPEARSEIEAWCLHALSVASSPLAVDLLLSHNERWSRLGVVNIEQADAYEGVGPCTLDALLHPPTVAAVGRANVGKSSLINALVGQQVALVADVAGTTRDHVGVPVDIGGLVVRWVDTPGVDEHSGGSGEVEIARRVVANANLVLHCIDAGDDPGELDQRFRSVISEDTPVVRVGMRSDLGPHSCRVDTRISVARGGGGGEPGLGISDLVCVLRDRLLPSEALADDRPWRFWGSLRGGA